MTNNLFKIICDFMIYLFLNNSNKFYAGEYGDDGINESIEVKLPISSP